ncbi:amastin-like protein, partial [Leishmania donovani]|uniref:Amastin-like protein n=1 Tax=Leishmania donovani TaxID=5661 RepID=E9BKU1_LEIDO
MRVHTQRQQTSLCQDSTLFRSHTPPTLAPRLPPRQLCRAISTPCAIASPAHLRLTFLFAAPLRRCIPISAF